MSITLTDSDVKKIKALHKENMDSLLKVVDGNVNTSKPQPITHKNASCLVAKAIGNQIAILNVINKASA